MKKIKLGLAAIIGLILCLIIIYRSNIFDNFAYQTTGFESDGKLLDCDNVKGEEILLKYTSIDRARQIRILFRTIRDLAVIQFLLVTHQHYIRLRLAI